MTILYKFMGKLMFTSFPSYWTLTFRKSFSHIILLSCVCNKKQWISIRCFKRNIVEIFSKMLIFVFFSLLIQRTLCDVILMVQERKIPAHRVVLASASHFFNLMFTSKSFENWLILNFHDDILLYLCLSICFILWKWSIWGISEVFSFCVLLPFVSVHASL